MSVPEAGTQTGTALLSQTAPSTDANLRLLHWEFPLDRSSSSPTLEPRDIHIWHGTPLRRPISPQRLIPLLSQDELDRMARFRFEPDRLNFAFARGMLRTVLGLYLGVPPEGIGFSYSPHGKPSLASGSSAALQFNLSHTAGYVLLAVCLSHDIGADVEKLRSDFETEELASRFFSPMERKALMRLPKAHRRRAFFHCWTRKEALLKARGGGLLLPLEDFDVSLGPGEKTVKLVTRPDPDEAHRWRILNVAVPDEYAAAVAVSC